MHNRLTALRTQRRNRTLYAAKSLCLRITRFAAIQLEDIDAPACFEVEERLREKLNIPVFHDGQHGTAIVLLAA